ncbi:hypothetical protein [Vibrio caribbeanicus]|uniref:hypothetical protein n=1 Tax=Vibrio caribbeanicus TaxID=701175 RepID=UPI0030DC804D
MKRTRHSYRLQLIKEAAMRQNRLSSSDQMTNYIQGLLDSKSDCDYEFQNDPRFSGCHFDDNIGGWVSNNWKIK